MLLSELKKGDKGIIVKVKGRGAFRKRIVEMGFIAGKEIEVIRKAPLKDPVEYKLLDYHVSLRNSEARLIEVVSIQEINNLEKNYNGVLEHEVLIHEAKALRKKINIALVGNPNCGKTTLFNFASGSRERVGNYCGVTVEAKEAIFKYKEYSLNIIDLPGTYSLTAYTPEEVFVRSYIAEEVPDVVINVLDSSNLERNLYLTTQLLDMDINMVIGMNMWDELEKRSDKFDYATLGKMIGVPMVPLVSVKGIGIEQLFEKVISVFEDREPTMRHIHINHGAIIERSIKGIQEKLKVNENLTLSDFYSTRFLAIKLIEKDKEILKLVEGCTNILEIKEVVNAQITLIEKEYKDDSETVLTDTKYGFIEGALKETFVSSKLEDRTQTINIDRILTHKYLGFPLFIVFMWLVFQLTFTLGSFPMVWIDNLVHFISGFVTTTMPSGILKDLLVDGIINGVGGVIVFLPNIVLLFIFISLMEDTGYMARAVFILDKAMHRFGLHGKSFIPLIMGFGCNVPAIMATRTIESKNDRLLTMLITPLMSCSARLPVYVLFISAFFPNNSGTVLFSIYISGIIMAALFAILFKKTLFRAKEVPFVMELPPYRIPTAKAILKHMWFKSVQYLNKIGGVILIASIIIWALNYFPINVDYAKNYVLEKDKIENHYKDKVSKARATDTSMINKLMIAQINSLQMEQKSEKQEKSYIGRIGKFIAPAIAPLGFDWKMGVSILTGLAAKEIVISTIGVLNQVDVNSEDADQTLINRLKTQVVLNGEHKGKPVYTPLVALTFMVFILLYFPCIGVLAAVNKESGKIKWALFIVFYTTALAWVTSFIVYTVGNMFF